MTTGQASTDEKHVSTADRDSSDRTGPARPEGGGTYNTVYSRPILDTRGRRIDKMVVVVKSCRKRMNDGRHRDGSSQSATNVTHHHHHVHQSAVYHRNHRGQK